jgi:hypothetical protein
MIAQFIARHLKTRIIFVMNEGMNDSTIHRKAPIFEISMVIFHKENNEKNGDTVKIYKMIKDKLVDGNQILTYPTISSKLLLNNYY